MRKTTPPASVSIPEETQANTKEDATTTPDTIVRQDQSPDNPGINGNNAGAGQLENTTADNEEIIPESIPDTETGLQKPKKMKKDDKAKEKEKAQKAKAKEKEKKEKAKKKEKEKKARAEEKKKKEKAKKKEKEKKAKAKAKEKAKAKKKSKKK